MEVIKFSEFMDGSYKVQALSTSEIATYELFKHLVIVIVLLAIGSITSSTALALLLPTEAIQAYIQLP